MGKRAKREKTFTIWKVRIGERYGSSTLPYLVLAPTLSKAEKKAVRASRQKDLMKNPQVESAERLGDLAN